MKGGADPSPSAARYPSLIRIWYPFTYVLPEKISSGYLTKPGTRDRLHLTESLDLLTRPRCLSTFSRKYMPTQ